MHLKDKSIVLTIGTRGIGEATALLLNERGAKVIITGRDELRGKEVGNKAKK